MGTGTATRSRPPSSQEPTAEPRRGRERGLTAKGAGGTPLPSKGRTGALAQPGKVSGGWGPPRRSKGASSARRATQAQASPAGPPAGGSGRACSSKKSAACKAPEGPRPTAGQTPLPAAFRGVTQPRYIEWCEHGSSHLLLTHRETGELLEVPNHCGSWRHMDSECQRRRAQQDFARIRVGLGKFAPGAAVLMVLTVRRPKRLMGMPPDDPRYQRAAARAYKLLERGGIWTRLQRMLMRTYGEPLLGKNGAPMRYRNREFKRAKPRYISVIEAQRDGWPHLNVLLESPALAELAHEYEKGNPHGRKPEGGTVISAAERWLKDAAVDCGFGYHATVTRVRAGAADDVASYVCKWYGSTDKATGEVSKMIQLPLNAPKGLWRIHATRGLLPPVGRVNPETGEVEQSDGKWTGKLVPSPLPAVQKERQAAARQELDDSFEVERLARLFDMEPEPRPYKGPTVAELRAELARSKVEPPRYIPPPPTTAAEIRFLWEEALGDSS